MSSNKKNEALRSLPSVNNVLKDEEIIGLISKSKFDLVSNISSKVIEDERRRIIAEDSPEMPIYDEIITKIKNQYYRLTTPNLQAVINGTGVILHTNLGRAKLSKDALLAVSQAAINYSNLEYNIDQGIRGSRHDHVEDLLIELTGAEAAMVVNNNAAAVILILKEMAIEKEVIVSRGQLVEIGGSFRVSEIMSQSGAKLVEVGTTNKTHRYDYERAISNNTGLLMKVHTSNFRIIGFTKEVCLKTLVELGAEHQLPVYEDLGSGLFYDFKHVGIGEEPTIQEVVRAGADIISFSGDKLLGGPQAGIIVGKKQYIDRLKKNQLARSLRVDKMTLAALEATLRHYLLNEAVDKIPTLKMILMNIKTIEQKSKILYEQIKLIAKDKAVVEIIDGYSEIGGGSMPDVQLPTKLIAIRPINLPIHKMEQSLRVTTPHVIGRISEDRFLLDIRTIEEDEYDIIAEKLQYVLK